MIYHNLRALPFPSSEVNWAGFYLRNGPSQLILGPFQGHVACTEIAFGKGVCGTAAQEKKAQVVPDVEAFPGHIACDSASKSEIVIPIVNKATDEVGQKCASMFFSSREVLNRKQLVAIIDIDCAAHEGFEKTDEAELSRLAELIAESCDW